MTGNSAAHEWDAVKCHPFTRPIAMFEAEMLRLATLEPWRCKVLDDAKTNRKMNLHGKRVYPTRERAGDLPCFNHQNFIGSSELRTALFGTGMLTSQFCLGKYLNASTHLLRCALCTRQSVGPRLHVIVGDQPECNVVFSGQVISYLEKWSFQRFVLLGPVRV